MSDSTERKADAARKGLGSLVLFFREMGSGHDARRCQAW